MTCPVPPSWPKQPTLESFRWHPSHGRLPSLLDLPHRVLTHSGRAAIGLALEEIGIQPGDGVLVPTYHCPTMIAPVERLGATPVFYGLDGDGMPLLSRISSEIHLRAALVPHLFGIPRPMSAIAEFCWARRITLIEDCAHCFFGRSGDAPVGTVGDYAIGSLPKFFPTLEGGILASSRHQIRARLPTRRGFGPNVRALWDSLDISARAGRLGSGGAALRALAGWRHGDGDNVQTMGNGAGPIPPEQVRHEALADPLLTPMGTRAIDAWLVAHSDPEINIEQRQQNFNRLGGHFAGMSGARPVIGACPPEAAPYVFPLLVDRPDEPYRRMREAGLPVFRWDRVWPGTPANPDDIGLRWARGLIQFACHQGLCPTDMERFATLARSCLTAAA